MINYNNILNEKSSDFYTFVALSDFKLSKRNFKECNIYVSLLFSSVIPRPSYKAIINGLDLFHFDNLLIIEIVRGDHIKDVLDEEIINIEYNQSKIIVRRISLYKFFSLNFFSYLIKDEKRANQKIVLYYKGFSWAFIKTLFKLYNINISTGNNTLKGIISPKDFLLSKVIMILYGFNTDIVNKSFNEFTYNKALSRALFNFTSAKDLKFLRILKKELNITDSNCNNKTKLTN